MRTCLGSILLSFVLPALTWVGNAKAQPVDSSDTGNAQHNHKHKAHDTRPDDETHTPGMNGQHDSMAGMGTDAGNAQMKPLSLIDAVELHSLAGTDVEPLSTPSSMLMTTKGNWMLMLHAVGFLSEIQQGGPRGDDKLFSTNWIMPMAQRKLDGGTLTLRTMLSLEPATVSERFYPELFQQGETAFGKPIIDGQHPHDFFMELGGMYDVKLGDSMLLSFYAAPVGDPAMGPPAYPHRASASEDPLAPLGHHLQDSTHIANDVITGGITRGMVRLEASGFHGREPDEYRWNIDSGKLDSWSTRLTLSPARNWCAQYSFAHLSSPEALHPEEDIDRMTASITYNRPLGRGNWASLLVWGRNKNQPSGLIWNSYLAESAMRFADSNYIWGRFENVDRTSELLPQNAVKPADSEESIAGRVQAFTFGYDRDIKVLSYLETAVGAQATFYRSPSSLTSTYGAHPFGIVMFARFRLVPKQK